MEAENTSLKDQQYGWAARVAGERHWSTLVVLLLYVAGQRGGVIDC